MKPKDEGSIDDVYKEYEDLLKDTNVTAVEIARTFDHIIGKALNQIRGL